MEKERTEFASALPKATLFLLVALPCFGVGYWTGYEQGGRNTMKIIRDQEEYLRQRAKVMEQVEADDSTQPGA